MRNFLPTPLSAGGSSSCKLLFVVALIRELHSRGHRTLVFSQSKVMLDILGAELRGMQLRFLRIDGSLSAKQREVCQSALTEEIYPALPSTLWGRVDHARSVSQSNMTR